MAIELAQDESITEKIKAIQASVAEVVADIHGQVASRSPDDQALAAMFIEAASVRLAELRTLLFMGAGGGMAFPESLKPLQVAIDQAVQTATDVALAGFPAANADEAVAVLESAEKSIEQARIAGIHLLGHLGAAIQRVERQKESQAKRPSLSLVHH